MGAISAFIIIMSPYLEAFRGNENLVLYSQKLLKKKLQFAIQGIVFQKLRNIKVYINMLKKPFLWIMAMIQLSDLWSWFKL